MIQKILKKTVLFTIVILGLIGLPYTKLYAQTSDPVVAGAGDISPQKSGTQFQTANLLNAINPTVVLTFGDNQYPDGILSDFNAYYNPSWGAFKSKTRPAPGNHDFHTPGAAGYFDYFNGVGVNSGPAGERGKGYYSFNVGSWHLISLNSEVMSTTQNSWLLADLQANQNTTCTLAYWHHPRFSSGASHGSSTRTAPFWDLLYQYKADLILAGHDHLYERFASQSPTGASDPARGIRQFIVGTGGAGLYPFGSPIANSQVRISTHGVIKLTLHANSYDWQFINLASQVLDSGSGTCVGGTPATSTPGPSSPPASPTPTGSPTNTPPPSDSTLLSMSVFLHGIGKAGDNVNPTSSGNMAPMHPQRTVSVELFDVNNQSQGVKQATVSFNTTSGNFQGVIDVGSLNSGIYTAKVQIPQYLSKYFPAILSLTKGQTNNLPPIYLVTGDANFDNKLSILDFTIILDCYSDLFPPSNCVDLAKKQAADLTDDGSVNQFDYNLFLRELSVQCGDGCNPTPTNPLTPTIKPTIGLSITPPPTQPPSGKANIVLVITDDQTYESVTAMPYLSSRSDWFTFNQATINVAYCCPSRATVLTGKYAHHTGVIDNGKGALMNESGTIAYALKNAGYRTGLIGKYLNGYPFGRSLFKPIGWDHWEAFVGGNPPGQFNYSMYENGITVHYGSTAADYSTDVVSQKTIKFLESTSTIQPFFLYVAPYAPHGPLIPAPRHVNAFAGQTMPRFPNFNEADVSDKPAWVRNLPFTNPSTMDGNRARKYEMGLAIDEMIQKIVETLSVRGMIGRTVIIFMTDNGYALGEHRHIQKLCQYEECIRTPLKIRYPFATSRVSDALVTNTDIAPTIAELAGISFATNDGFSILPLLRNSTNSLRSATLHYWKGDSSVGGFWAIRRKDFKYVELLSGERELYDLINDPYELVNRAGTPAYSSIQAQLASQLQLLKQ